VKLALHCDNDRSYELGVVYTDTQTEQLQSGLFWTCIEKK